MPVLCLSGAQPQPPASDATRRYLCRMHPRPRWNASVASLNHGRRARSVSTDRTPPPRFARRHSNSNPASASDIAQEAHPQWSTEASKESAERKVFLQMKDQFIRLTQRVQLQEAKLATQQTQLQAHLEERAHLTQQMAVHIAHQSALKEQLARATADAEARSAALRKLENRLASSAEGTTMLSKAHVQSLQSSNIHLTAQSKLDKERIRVLEMRVEKLAAEKRLLTESLRVRASDLLERSDAEVRKERDLQTWIQAQQHRTTQPQHIEHEQPSQRVSTMVGTPHQSLSVQRTQHRDSISSARSSIDLEASFNSAFDRDLTLPLDSGCEQEHPREMQPPRPHPGGGLSAPRTPSKDSSHSSRSSIGPPSSNVSSLVNSEHSRIHEIWSPNPHAGESSPEAESPVALSAAPAPHRTQLHTPVAAAPASARAHHQLLSSHPRPTAQETSAVVALLQRVSTLESMLASATSNAQRAKHGAISDAERSLALAEAQLAEQRRVCEDHQAILGLRERDVARLTGEVAELLRKNGALEKNCAHLYALNGQQRTRIHELNLEVKQSQEVVLNLKGQLRNLSSERSAHRRQTVDLHQQLHDSYELNKQLMAASDESTVDRRKTIKEQHQLRKSQQRIQQLEAVIELRTQEKQADIARLHEQYSRMLYEREQTDAQKQQHTEQLEQLMQESQARDERRSAELREIQEQLERFLKQQNASGMQQHPLSAGASGSDIPDLTHLHHITPPPMATQVAQHPRTPSIVSGSNAAAAVESTISAQLPVVLPAVSSSSTLRLPLRVVPEHFTQPIEIPPFIETPRQSIPSPSPLPEPKEEQKTSPVQVALNTPNGSVQTELAPVIARPSAKTGASERIFAPQSVETAYSKPPRVSPPAVTATCTMDRSASTSDWTDVEETLGPEDDPTREPRSSRHMRAQITRPPTQKADSKPVSSTDEVLISLAGSVGNASEAALRQLRSTLSSEYFILAPDSPSVESIKKSNTQPRRPHTRQSLLDNSTCGHSSRSHTGAESSCSRSRSRSRSPHHSQSRSISPRSRSSRCKQSVARSCSRKRRERVQSTTPLKELRRSKEKRQSRSKSPRRGRLRSVSPHSRRQRRGRRGHRISGSSSSSSSPRRRSRSTTPVPQPAQLHYTIPPLVQQPNTSRPFPTSPSPPRFPLGFTAVDFLHHVILNSHTTEMVEMARLDEEWWDLRVVREHDPRDFCRLSAEGITWIRNGEVIAQSTLLDWSKQHAKETVANDFRKRRIMKRWIVRTGEQIEQREREEEEAQQQQQREEAGKKVAERISREAEAEMHKPPTLAVSDVPQDTSPAGFIAEKMKAIAFGSDATRATVTTLDPSPHVITTPVAEPIQGVLRPMVRRVIDVASQYSSFSSSSASGCSTASLLSPLRSPDTSVHVTIVEKTQKPATSNENHSNPPLQRPEEQSSSARRVNKHSTDLPSPGADNSDIIPRQPAAKHSVTRGQPRELSEHAFPSIPASNTTPHHIDFYVESRGSSFESSEGNIDILIDDGQRESQDHSLSSVTSAGSEPSFNAIDDAYHLPHLDASISPISSTGSSPRIKVFPSASFPLQSHRARIRASRRSHSSSSSSRSRSHSPPPRPPPALFELDNSGSTEQSSISSVATPSPSSMRAGQPKIYVHHAEKQPTSKRENSATIASENPGRSVHFTPPARTASSKIVSRLLPRPRDPPRPTRNTTLGSVSRMAANLRSPRSQLRAAAEELRSVRRARTGST